MTARGLGTEWTWGGAIALAGVGARLAMVRAFPTRAVSDFHHLVELGRMLAERSWFVPTWHWEFFNPGLPDVLALVFSVLPGQPEAIARLTTAASCGLLGLLPYLLWRGALPFGARCAAGCALALWPGQVVFSGVVAQDNWVLLPAVALLALTVRTVRLRSPSPWLAGALYALAAATRQEMLLTLAPAALVAAGLLARDGAWTRRAAALAAGAALILGTFALQRAAATGELTILTAHTGTTVFSAYIPGATANNWADPVAYAAAVRPDLVVDRSRLQEEAWSLTWQEIRRRPAFHAYRVVSCLLRFAVDSEADNLHWSLRAVGVQPPEREKAGAALAARLAPWLRLEMAAIFGVALAVIWLGAMRWDPAILALAGFIGSKVLLHAVTMAQGRYFLAVTAGALLLCALAGDEARCHPRRAVALFAASAALAAALLLVTPAVVGHVHRLDVMEQLHYRFVLLAPDGSGSLTCEVANGKLLVLEPASFVLQPMERDPRPGEAASARCRLDAVGPGVAVLEVEDAYPAGGLPGRMLQRVDIDGREVWRHDLAADAWQGSSRVPLGSPPGPAGRSVVLRLVAIAPELDAAWGWAAASRVSLASAEPGSASPAESPADLAPDPPQEPPAGPEAADLGLAVTPVPVDDRELAKLEAQTACTEELIELGERVEVVGEGADFDHAEIVLAARAFEPAEGVAQADPRHRAEQEAEGEVAGAIERAHALEPR